MAALGRKIAGMSLRGLMIVAMCLGIPLGLISGLSGWSETTNRSVIILGTLLGVIGFIWLPDAIRDRRGRNG
jgi:predicted MFS family arabinose efflux permease